jgi:cytochrome c5
MALWVLCASIAALSACGSASKEPDASDIARAQEMRPRDAQLAERYERTCMACHANQNSGAPLTGFAPHWRSRAAKGMDLLVQRAYDGFNAMPGRGLCNDCTPDDLRALIQFMIDGGAT